MKILKKKNKKEHKLIIYDNKILRMKSLEVKKVDKEIKDIVKDMYTIMKDNRGIGLAGVQIGELKRIIIIDLTEVEEDIIIKPEKIILINPVILSTSEREDVAEEGCLSVPGKRGNVKRSFWIEIEGYTLDEKYYHKKLSGLAARVAQHEIDHLNGVLFIDKVI